MTWTTIDPADLVSGQPITADLLAALNGNITDVHDDIGTLSTPPSYATPNLLVDFLPRTDGDHWVRFGAGITRPNKGDDGLSWSGASGQGIYMPVNARGSSTKNQFGKNNWCASIMVRANGSLTTGELRFGLSDGSTSTYLTGGRASIAAADLTTGWQRFFTIITDVPSGTPSTMLWFTIRVQNAFDGAMYLSCFNLCAGATELHPPMPCPVDFGAHEYYGRYANNIPWLDRVITMDNAVEKTAA